jgi:hypothetical protein
MIKEVFNRFIKRIKNNKSPETPTGIWHAPVDLFPDRDNVVSVFEKIYHENIWGDGSGGGSLPEVVVPYKTYLENFLKIKNISSVVDLGCGDWQFSKYINWDGIDYLGVDVVENVILENKQKYLKQNISFANINVLDQGFETIPDSDLLIAKDVLQHLANSNIKKMIDGMTSGKFKYALITNDYSSINIDIQNGDTRPLDLRLPPFNMLEAKPVLNFLGKTTFLIDVQEFKK